MTKAHPLRCETCDHHTENQYMDFCYGFPMSKDDPTELVTFIRYHGCAGHSSAKSEAVLDVTLVKILEDFRMLSFNASSQHMQAISLYNAQEIVKQRLGEFVRGEQ